ncbi:uncharacterized protein C8orf88 homolog [Mixophyes fleayi]|uniref:uncharacterized protein C8orf88 homolog n=1 Tax=Mixophyes fleayi TaxID=3061075 RepID=UPI003F4DB046
MEPIRSAPARSAQCPRRGPVTGPVTVGCRLQLSDEMEVKKLIRKPLQPARPIRRGVPDNAPLFMVNLRAEFTDCCKDDLQDPFNLWCSIGKLYDVLKDPVVPKPPEIPQMQTRKGRITYTRDFLIQLSSLSVSRQKPKYLPDHPVVLEHPLSELKDETFPLSSTSPSV